MSDPVAQASDLTVEDCSLKQSSTFGKFSNSLHDTFAAWLEDLKPALEADQKVAPAQVAFDHAQRPGELRFEGTLRVDCYLALRLRSLTGTLFISETGEVESDIVVAAAIIDGVLRGNIQASEHVELHSQAKVFGNIESPSLAIQPGAVFEGQCHFQPPPLESSTAEHLPPGGIDASINGKKVFTSSPSSEETEEVEQPFAAVAG
jgi:cytoskeletal protein CcmA (bactofilin family)